MANRTLVVEEKFPTISEALTERVFVATHPTRLEILLRLENEKAYAAKLEGMMKIDRKIISFHLSALEKADLVTSKFALKDDSEDRPIAVKYYELTPTGREVLKKLKTILTR